MTTHLIVRAIDARLAEIEEEKNELLRLRGRYAEPHAAADQLPLPGIKTGPEPKASRMGITEAILSTVRAHAGIGQEELMERVLELSNSDAGDPRKSIATTARYLLTHNRLMRTADGRYYLPSSMPLHPDD